MKNGKKPTRRQREVIKSKRLNAANWLVVKDTSIELELVHRRTGSKKIIHKD